MYNIYKASVSPVKSAWGPRYIASGRIQQKTPPPNNSSIAPMGSCLAIARITLKCLPTVTKQQLLSRCLFRGLCLATGL
jgi:hypothetical protein